VSTLFENLADPDLQIFSFQTVLSTAQKSISYAISNQLNPQDPSSGPFLLEIISDTGPVLHTFLIPIQTFQRLISHKFGDQAIQAIPVLGYQSKEKLSETTYRVVSIAHHRFAPFKEQVHDFDISEQPAALPFHDYHHCLVDSANPIRPIYVELSQFPERMGITGEKATNWKVTCLDREDARWFTRAVNPTEDPTTLLNEILISWGLILSRIHNLPREEMACFIGSRIVAWEKEYSQYGLTYENLRNHILNDVSTKRFCVHLENGYHNKWSAQPT
jgi:hypothetical protein